MGEIDDLYKQEAEDIDTNFLEGLKDSRDHQKDIENYRKNLEKARLKFEKKYGKFNAGEKKRIRKMKKKLEKMPKFKHLEIEHFDFKFGFWERLWFRGDIFIFNIMRKIKRFFAWVFPNWFIYNFYNARNYVRSTWRDFVEYVSGIWRDIKKFVIKWSLWAWDKIKKFWAFVKLLGGKMLFWKKKGEKPAADKDGKPIETEGEKAAEDEKKKEEKS